MMRLKAQRRIRLIAAAISAAAIVGALHANSLALGDSARASGWLLAFVSLFLLLYNLRKKLPYPPLLRSSTWLQLHVYTGFIACVIFVYHVGLDLPNGAFERGLAVLYAAVALSGIVGLALSRLLPARLSVRGEEVLFERIPIYRRQLREQAEALLERSVEGNEVTTLPEFYRRHLARFFAQPRNYWHHVVQSTRPRHRLTNELRAHHRYLSPDELELADQLERLIEQKDTLDYQQAMQGTLKGWLFVHIPLSYSLVLFTVLHVRLVAAFSAP